MTGLHLSHYAIEAELGRGGMGIVYRARDTKLNRTVALKVLPAAALASEDDKARFLREAQSAAALNHPNVCHVYQVDEATPANADGGLVEGHTEPRLFIAMEYIDGETLHDYVKKGPLKLQEAVNIAGQIAEALKEAHAKDIVHRDIKSANIMLTEGGVAKVLDFGLAKTNQSTMLTRMGSTLGTVAYMSPEQARGQEVDGRSDLYSLGTVLYEMVAGRLPYSGDYEQAVLYGILNEAPEPLTAVRTGVPMQMEWVVNKLLAKEAEYRYQSAAGLLADLKSLDLSGSGRTVRSMPAMAEATGKPASAEGLSAPVWLWPALLGVLIAGAAAGWLLKPAAEVLSDTAIRSLTLELPAFRRVDDFDTSDDGRFLAIAGLDSVGVQGVYITDVETGKTDLLVQNASSPAISREGSSIAFWREGGLYTVPVSGGTPVRVAERAGRTKTWLRDNSLVYHSGGDVWLRPGDGSEPRVVVTAESTGFRVPSSLPGDKALILSASGAGDSGEHLEVVDLATGNRTRIGPGTRPRYLSSGHLLYGDASSGVTGSLFVRPFDLESYAFTGVQQALYDDAPIWTYEFDNHGTFYHRINDTESIETDRAVFAQGPGDAEPRLIVSAASLEVPRVSRSDGRVAVTVEAGDDYLMIYDPVTDVKQRITFSGDEDHHAWSADGERILVERDRALEIWSTRGDGLLETLPPVDVVSFDWSWDGRFVAYEQGSAPGLHLFDLETREDTVIESLRAEDPAFSPNGRFVAYSLETESSVETAVRALDGQTEVRLFVGGPSGEPRWSRDGTAIFVRVERGVMRVPVTTSSGFSQTGPAEFVLPVYGGGEFDVGPDDTIFFWSSQSGQTEGSARLSVIVNWFEQIKRIAPASK